MTEAEFNRCGDPQAILEFLRETGNVSQRKLRLFACACARRFWWGPLSEGGGRRAVEVSERYADGLADHHERISAWDPDDPLYRTLSTEMEYDRAIRPDDPLHLRAAAAACWTSEDDSARSAQQAVNLANADERGGQAELLRDLIGPLPFRPVAVGLSLRAWDGGSVVRLATAAYEERSLPDGSLDDGRLAVLADALEEAGCADPEILGHLRAPGPHVRGCWAVDLVLNKG